MDGALLSSSKPTKYKGLTKCKKRMAHNGEKGRNSGAKDDNFFPGACWKSNKKGHKAMHCKPMTHGAESNTNQVNLKQQQALEANMAKDFVFLWS
jgi:hypothetical protein